MPRSAPRSIPSGTEVGGSAYLSSTLTRLRRNAPHSLTVAAGDLIGGSPFLSGLFHDEPAVEALEAMRLDVSSVGNHEFDEGMGELNRMQYGGCHPVDGCFQKRALRRRGLPVAGRQRRVRADQADRAPADLGQDRSAG